LVDWINREAGWKKSDAKESSLTQGLFGIIRNLHRRISCSEPATIFPRYETPKLFEEYRREFEMQKSKAIAHVRLQTRLV